MKTACVPSNYPKTFSHDRSSIPTVVYDILLNDESQASLSRAVDDSFPATLLRVYISQIRYTEVFAYGVQVLAH